MNIKNRLNEINYNKYGDKMKIIAYRKAIDIDILFEDYNYIITNRKYGDFIKGKVKCPYSKTVENIGYLGEDFEKDDYKTKCYETWSSMIWRVYNKKFHEKYPTYKNCEVCKEWLNFSNFKKWYNKNYYEIPNEDICLDKDILVKGNKIYSPNTCVFIPKPINSAFVKCDAKRTNLPIGIIKYKDGYRARVKNKSKTFKNLNDAFSWYSEQKKIEIRKLANIYKEYISNDLYAVMLDYEININD